MVTNQIAEGYFLVGDSSKFFVRTYQDYMFELGFEGDDFKKNIRSMRAEMRLHAYLPTNNLTAFIYDSIADVKTQLTKTV